MPNISYTFWMGVLISILNPVPNISYIFLVSILISILISVPDSSAQYFIYTLSGCAYLHTKFSAWIQCSIFHAYSEWASLSPSWIECLIPVPNISYTFWVGVHISILNPVPESSVWYSEWAFISPYWIQCQNPVPDTSYILGGHSYLHTKSSA